MKGRSGSDLKTNGKKREAAKPGTRFLLFKGGGGSRSERILPCGLIEKTADEKKKLRNI